MCKKDTDGGSYCCCKCCTPTVSSIVVAIVGAAILVASFVIAAVVLTMLQDGIVKTARYNSPRSDSKAFNDWLSNVPSKRSTNDAALKYYQYYFFNITNLDAVIANSLTSNPATPTLVYPTVEEIGPYTYRYFVDRLDPTFDADDERLTYKEYYRYIFDASLSKMGSRNLDDQTDVFTTVSLVYSSMFGNPFQETGRMPTSSGLFGSPEIGFRFATGFQLWLPYLQWLDTVGRTSVNGSLFNPLEFASPSSAIPLPACIANPLSASCYQSIFAVQTVMTNVFTPNMKAKYPLGSASAFVDFGNQLLPAGQNKWTEAIPIEYWAFVATNGNNPLWYITDPNVMSKLLNSTLLNIGGCQFALGGTNAAGCWISATTATLNAAVAPRVGLTSDQVDGLKAYANYVVVQYYNWLMKSNGHLGHLYGSQFRAADAACAATQPAASYLSYTYTGTGGCVTFNNANMYIKATPRSLLFEQYNTLGAFLFASSVPARTFNRRTNLSFSTNYTSELDARQDSWQYTVGTGINHINDIDNLYLWKNKTQINTDLTGTWCHKSSDPTYAPSGIYPMQHFTIIPGYTYFQANQAQMTKYTPSYPPGKVSDSNRYSFEKSLISDKSFALDLFVGDISRHAKMVFYRDASIKGIDIQRYTIDESEFAAGLEFFGQYFYGLANYSCPAAGGVNTFSCYPRFGKLNSTVLAAANNFLGVNGAVAWTTGIDLAQIVNLPSNDDFLANAQFGANFGDANELIAMIDLEPVSGAALGGTLKQQVNILIQPYIGSTLAIYKGSKTVAGNASPFGAYFRSAAPNAPYGRATLFPVYWLNKIGFLSDKQADTFKSTVYGAQLASRVVLIVGTIVGGLMFFVALGFVLVKRRAGYNTQTSKSDLAL